MIRYLSIGILFLCISCQDVQKPVPPENLIPEEQMVDILTDVYLANAAKSVNNKIIRNKGVKLDSFIYAKYQIDSLRFAESNAYYTTQLNTYNDFFVEIERRLNQMQQEVDSLQKQKGEQIRQKTNRRQDTMRSKRKIQLIDAVETGIQGDSIE